MSSLRTRLLIATALVLVALVFVAWLFSSFTVKREFDRFLVAQRGANEMRALDEIRSHVRTTGSWRGIEPILARFRVRALIADPAGRIVFRYPADLDRYRTEIRPNGELHLSRRVGATSEALIVKRPMLRFPDATLYLLPSPQEPLQRTFRGTIDRWLIAGLVVAALSAFAITLMIFRRVFAPVEALTAGARSLGEGRLDARVAVRGNDEIAELARSFNVMAAALQRNEEVRRNMVSDVAHELRTPLTNLRCQIEAVQDGVLAADAKVFQSLAEETRNLSVLVDDLQQLSLAEAGKLRLEMGTFSLAEIVDRSLEGVVTGDIRIERDVPGDLNVRADLRRIVQVMRNLIDNALAHARSRIAIRARDGEITVSDDGPGIPPEHLDRVFDRFHRVDPSRSRRTGGTGLGLAIARELVRLHGGTIRAQNGDNGGAQLTFTLPFIRSS